MPQKKYYYKVVYGYSPMDFISITEEKLPRAIYAKQTNSLFKAGGKFISGSEIKRIEPHIQKYTGWHEDYKFGSHDDMLQIERDCPKELDIILEKSFDLVQMVDQTGNLNLLDSTQDVVKNSLSLLASKDRSSYENSDISNRLLEGR